MEKRITELEIKLAFTEDLLETLNQTVFRQQEQIERIERQVRELLQNLPTEQHSLRDELPPHY